MTFLDTHPAEELVRRLRLERLNPGRPLGEKVRALVDAALAAAPLFSEPEPLVQLMTPACFIPGAFALWVEIII